MSYLYFSPKNYGLTEIAEFDTADDWEFDMVVVWRDGEGKLWAAHDSGCSCPTPFEDHTFPTDFVEVRALTDLDPLIAEAREHSDHSQPNDLPDFKRKVREALKA